MQNVVLHVIIMQWLNLKKMQVKYSTYVKYKKVIELHIDPYFGQCTASKINEKMIYQFFILKKEDVSVSMLQIMRYLLKSILSFACCQYAYPQISFDNLRLSANKTKMKGLTKDEEQKLGDFCLLNPSPLSLSILLGLYAGMRIGEICALQWEDIDFKEGIIQVRHTVQRLEMDERTGQKTRLYLSEPKTFSSQRAIPLVPFLQAYLMNYCRQSEFDLSYFVVSETSRPLDPRTLQYRYKQLCKQLAIEESFHSLRHRFATSCIEHQVDVKSLSEVLGHADVTTTLRRYVHSSMEFKKQQLNKLRAPSFYAE